MTSDDGSEVDLQETPATPPESYGGDERAGLLAAGSTLMALGWGVGIFLNLALHAIAGARGLVFGPFRVYPTFGPFAEAAMLIGFLTGALGFAMAALATDLPKGRLVLPGYDYSSSPAKS